MNHRRLLLALALLPAFLFGFVRTAGAQGTAFTYQGSLTDQGAPATTDGSFSSDGGRYLPAGNTWAPVSPAGLPAGRYDHTAIWTGSEMIIWGGTNDDYWNDGGRYNPATNSWTRTGATLTPARIRFTAVGTGTGMIVWGGLTITPDPNATWLYTPGKTMFLYQKQ